MSLIITGKGDFSLLQNFKSGDFSAYELYLNTYDESFVDQQINLLPDHINITSIHNPTQIIIDGKRTLFDLADPGKIGEESLNVLQKTISLGKKLGSKIIVIHGATYNHYNQTKNEALELLASRVKPLLGGEISLSFETDMLWHHLFYTKRPVLATLEDFNKLDHLIDGYLKITADIEHLNLTFIFLKFVEYFGGEKAFFQRYSEFNRFAFEKDIIFYII